jgi:hypothetical protein
VLPVGRDLERALNVAGALRPGQADLLLGRADPPQRFRCHFHAGLPLDGARQRPGLVVTAAPAVNRRCAQPGDAGQCWANKAYFVGLTFISDMQCRA